MFALDLLNQFQSYNGTLLAAGKIYVYNLGRTQLATVYGDHNGATPIANPVILDDQGMAEIYLNDAFNYTVVVYDAYGQEQFSRDIYPRGMGNGESIGTQLYEGVDPIVVNNDVYAISANTTKLGVQEPLYFVQDDSERVIIGFSGHTDVPEGTMNESAFGYQDGQITSYNGSAFSAGNSYEAGSYIDINGNTISVTGLTPVPADTASTGLVASVSADITAMIPDVSDMATQTWVNEQGFLTAHQDISDKLDTTAFSTVSSDFITAIPSEYVTENTLQSGLSSKLDSTAFSTVSGSFLTAHQSLDGLMSADLLEISDNKITGYNGTAFAGQGGGGVTGDFTLVEGNGIQLTDDPIAQTTTISVSGDYATNTQLQNVSADITAMIPTALTGDYLDKASADTLYYPLESNPNGYLTAETDWTNTITAASANAYNEATAAIPTGLATTGDLANVSADITAQIPTDLFTKASADTLYQPIGDYLTTGDSANFATTGDVEDLITSISETYQTTAGMTAYMTTADSAEFMTTAERSDYIPTGVSSEFYTTANTANYISEVPDTYLQNTDLSTEDGKVTAISGIPLSAGGDVPEGVMVESGLEYNAVNEISAYNGSAIAQYGAEKQWLVTDDTMVHLSNSAQFALGVNISAVAQLLGVDETVLFSATTSAGVLTANLSEPLSSFNTIEVYSNRRNAGDLNLIGYTKFNTDYTPTFISITGNTIGGTAQTFLIYEMFGVTQTALTYISGTNIMINGTNMSVLESPGFSNAGITKVIGIGRKEV